MAEVSEIMSTFDFSQLVPGQSQDQCGYAATALCFAAGPPGGSPKHPVQWAIQQMASWYTEFNGPDIPSNTKGMMDWQLYKLIVEKGGHYQAIDPHAASIASWIEAKYPVIVAVQESSVYDVHLDACPYTWDVEGLNHIFTVTGIDHGHIFLCRDTVNQHEGSPYSYDGDKLVYLSATVFVPDWLPRPTSAIAPHAEAAPAGLPAGWKDDGHNLYDPHGKGPLTDWARAFVLENHWDPGNTIEVLPYYTQQLEASNLDLGPGDQVVFLKSTVARPHDPKDAALKNKVIVEYVGRELVTTRQQVAKYYNAFEDLRRKALAIQADNIKLQSDNAKLQADLQALQQGLPTK